MTKVQGRLQNDFDRQAQYFAKKCILDVRDIRETYKNKPENLKEHFDEASGIEFGNRAGPILLGVMNAIVGMAIPLILTVSVPVCAGATYLCIRDEVKKLRDIEEAVSRDVDAYRAAKSAAPAPQA